ncbi:MAG: hypothetical protein M3539_13815 [Acidobacteriota bacterium]|nr:hypothetical protein [Acidobacteriota bacterium]
MTLRNVRMIFIAFVGFAVFASVGLFAAETAYAQSSGNFTASIQTSQCTINTMPSPLSPTPGSLSGGGGTLLETYIKTPNSKFTTLLITPSLVTGLFTNTTVTTSMPSQANSAAVVVSVTLDGKPVLPATAATPGVIYDQRFQQLSTNVFERISGCENDPECNIELILSTLSAHSFNFIAPDVGGGVHPLRVEWEFVCTDNNGAVVPCTQTYTANTAGACAGPGTVTVTQVKAFSQSGGITVP